MRAAEADAAPLAALGPFAKFDRNGLSAVIEAFTGAPHAPTPACAALALPPLRAAHGHARAGARTSAGGRRSAQAPPHQSAPHPAGPSAEALPAPLKDWVFDLCRSNMEAMYASVWGWKDAEKRRQLNHVRVLRVWGGAGVGPRPGQGAGQPRVRGR